VPVPWLYQIDSARGGGGSNGRRLQSDFCFLPNRTSAAQADDDDRYYFELLVGVERLLASVAHFAKTGYADDSARHLRVLRPIYEAVGLGSSGSRSRHYADCCILPAVT